MIDLEWYPDGNSDYTKISFEEFQYHILGIGDINKIQDNYAIY